MTKKLFTTFLLTLFCMSVSFNNNDLITSHEEHYIESYSDIDRETIESDFRK